MILELLKPDPDVVSGVLVLVRGGYNAATLVAVGLVFFSVGFDHRLVWDSAARLRRLLLVAVVLALGLSVGALALRAVVLGGSEAIADAALWGELLRSRNGDAFFLRAAGLVLMLAMLPAWRVGPVVSAVGACVAIASFAAVGHSTSIAPRQEIVALLVVHLAALAFWVGSLPVLSDLAGRGDVKSARIIEDWSRIAMAAVAAMLVSAALLVWYLKAGRPINFAGWYDFALAAKLGIVLVAIGFAAVNKWRLTPGLLNSEAGAGRRLAWAIRIEFVILLTLFFVASELVSVHPNPPADAGR
jgi:copper resistance protein D